MDGAAWARTKSLLAEAADLPAADRERFVSERCPDPSLRRELLDLLNSPAPLSSILAAGILAPGTAIGSYLIEQPLGRGGMGEVFRARDTVLNRRVAIKVLPPALAVRTDRVARFRREAQLLAALNHPNIAQIHGARLELEEAAERDAAPPHPARSARFVPIGVAIALAAAAAIAAGVVAWGSRGSPAASSTPNGSFTIALPADATVAGLDTPAIAISPDGTRIVYVGGAARRLYVRRIDDPAVTPVAGTEGASTPFFAPDGRSVGFFAGGRIQRVSLDGGVPSVIGVCSAGNPRGAVWGADGTIVFAPFPASTLMRVNVDESVDRPVTVLDLKRGEGGHRWPDFVAGGGAVVFVTGTATARTWDDGDIIIQSLTTGERRILAQGTFPRFTASGHLLYVRAGVLLAAPFDVKRLAISGPATRIADGVMQSTFGAAQFAVSNTGALVHLAGSVGQRQLTWVARSGVLEPLPVAARTYWAARLSPDGLRLATVVENPGYDIWTYDFSSGGAALDRLTSGVTHAWPVWSADGTHITFNSTQDTGVLNLFWKRADGSGSESV